jgi:hypothetical protein
VSMAIVRGQPRLVPHCLSQALAYFVDENSPHAECLQVFHDFLRYTHLDEDESDPRHLQRQQPVAETLDPTEVEVPSSYLPHSANGPSHNALRGRATTLILAPSGMRSRSSLTWSERGFPVLASSTE